MKSVLVFKTSVTSKSEVNKLQPALNQLMHKNERWNFDLEDCDHILRVETLDPKPEKFITVIKREGYFCEELED